MEKLIGSTQLPQSIVERPGTVAAMSRFSIIAWLLAFFTFAVAFPIDGREAASAVPTIQGAPAIMGPGSSPRATHLKDGSILAAHGGVDPSGTVAINVVRSVDQGRTWTPVGVVATAPAATRDMGNTVFQQLPDGRIVTAYRNHDMQDGKPVTFRLSLSISTDNGVTWAFLSEITNPGPEFHGLWEPVLRLKQDGSLQMYYSHELNGNNQVNYMRPSPDGGKTWGAPVVVTQKDNVRDGMLGLAELGGGKVVAVFEAGYPFTINMVTSADDGLTWSARQRIYAPTPARLDANAGAPQVAAVGQNLVCTFMTNEDAPAPLHWYQNANSKIITSADGGATWGNKLTVGEAYSVWPGVLGLNDTTFLSLIDHQGAKALTISLA